MKKLMLCYPLVLWLRSSASLMVVAVCAVGTPKSMDHGMDANHA